MTSVMLIDDSALFRRMVGRLLAKVDVPGGLALHDYASGKEAVEHFPADRPEFVVCDVHMPEDDALATLQMIRDLCTKKGLPLPKMVLVSARPDAATMAGAAKDGVVGFMPKPASPAAIDEFRDALMTLIQAKPNADVVTKPYYKKTQKSGSLRFKERPPAAPALTASGRRRLILIASSTGGPAALAHLLPALAAHVSDPVVVVQHLPSDFAPALAQHLSGLMERPVEVARDGMDVVPGKMYLADGGWHLGIGQVGSALKCVRSGEQPVGGHMPAGDVLFKKAAELRSVKICAIVLTGMGKDGSQGAKALHEQGAHVIAQDEASSVVWGMPGSTVKLNAAHQVLPLADIADAVIHWRTGR